MSTDPKRRPRSPASVIQVCCLSAILLAPAIAFLGGWATGMDAGIALLALVAAAVAVLFVPRGRPSRRSVGNGDEPDRTGDHEPVQQGSGNLSHCPEDESRRGLGRTNGDMTSTLLHRHHGSVS